jgi:uncharacterized membrane protein (UPF0136 family)
MVVMDDTETHTLNRSTVIHTLAVVGFVALIGASMWLAVYSARFIPVVVNRVGGTSAYLSTVFKPVPAPARIVAPATSTTTTTAIVATATSTVATTPKPIPIAPETKANNTYQIVAGTPVAVAPYGLPDLAVTVTAVGYLESASTDSFVASTTVSSGYRPAVKFTIKNIGTNWTGVWRFSASIPTRGVYIFESDRQQSLASGESIDYTLGFDRALSGTQQIFSITANFDHVVLDSNVTNNSATAYINVL